MRSMAIVVLAAFFVQDTWAVNYIKMPSGTACDEGWSLITTQSECINAASIVGHEQRNNLDDAILVDQPGNTYTAGCYLNNFYGDSDLQLIVNPEGIEGQCSPPVWGDTSEYGPMAGMEHHCYQICKQTAPTISPADMCGEKINEEMKVIEETLTRCAEEGHSGPSFDYCVLGICGTEFTAGYTVCQQSRFWRMARDCDTRVCVVDLRKFWLTTPTPNGYQLPTGNGNGNWKWVPYQGGN